MVEPSDSKGVPGVFATDRIRGQKHLSGTFAIVGLLLVAALILACTHSHAPRAMSCPLKPGWFRVTAKAGLHCRGRNGSKVGSVGFGHRFMVLKLEDGAEFGSAFLPWGGRRIWGRAGVLNPEWLPLTEENGCTAKDGDAYVQRISRPPLD